MINLPTKFEVSIFARYGDVKGVKMHKMEVVWGGQGSPKVIGNVTIRQSTYDFPFVFNRNYASILYRFRDTASYLTKFAKFDLLHLQMAPPFRVTPVEFRKDFLASEKHSPRAIMRRSLRHPTFSRFSRTPTCDRQTDRQTGGYRTMAYTAQGIVREVKTTAKSIDMYDDADYSLHFLNRHNGTGNY